jgi:hypothetical protein
LRGQGGEGIRRMRKSAFTLEQREARIFILPAGSPKPVPSKKRRVQHMSSPASRCRGSGRFRTFFPDSPAVAPHLYF